MEPTITCPKCGGEIKLTESLAAPLVEATKRDFEAQLAAKEKAIAERETELRAGRQALTDAQASLETQVAERVAAERLRIAEDEGKKARLLLEGDMKGKDDELAALKEVLQQRNTKLEEAQKAQAELLRKERELDDARREVDLTVEKKVQESLGAVRDKAKREAEDSLQLKVREKEEQIASMQRQIEDLKRKAEQGSQQLQGEAQELHLEEVLKAKFPRDTFEPVAKGEFGGDLVHRVFNNAGQPCGTILWETKRTRNWSDGWLPKLRADQRAAKADVALIVSHALPKGMSESFNLIDGVWVAEPACALPVAVALRESLIALAGTRQSLEGQQTKAEMVYQYLTGPRFRHRVEAIVEKFTEMHVDLDRERKAMTRIWAKREEQLRGVIEATAGMYGDLEGIAGKSLGEIEGLSLELIEGPEGGDRT